MRLIVALALLFTVSACTANGTIGTAAVEPETTTTAAAPISTLPPVVECPGQGDFEEGTGIAEIDSTASDSSIINRISWDTSDRCETFLFDFATSEGAPATTAPDIRIDHLETFQVVRLSLDVDASVVVDQLVETGLVSRLYAVRSLDGGMFIDLHLAQPAAVRATILSSPARLRVELRPGFVAFTGQSSLDERIVTVSPSAGSEIGTTAVFNGYARTSDGDVLVLVTKGRDVVSESFTTTAENEQTWGEFSLTLDLPAGDVSVFLGEEEEGDGGLEGLTMDLTASSDPLSR